jgi:cytoskeletal protein CcmA (bactofilin family)
LILQRWTSMQESGTIAAGKADHASPSALNAPRALPNGIEIRGLLKFSQDLLFEGRLEGEVHSGAMLTVGNGGEITGDIKCRSIVVFGRIQGSITVTERCLLKDTASVIGDITATRLSIDGGAVFVGQCKAGKVPS